MQPVFDRLWHKVLRQPYQAVCTEDIGSGPPVVLLHGLGSTSKVWEHLTTLLASNHRVLTFDLLGFGDSPKPDWLDYTVDDHAQAIWSAVKKRNVAGPIVFVGHSMGCLVAVHIARLHPGYVKRLVLYEMPLYTEASSLKRYTMLRKLYFAAYNRVLKHPNYSPSNARMIQKLAARLAGFEISKQTWTPFVKSLKNTIMTQTTADDMKRLTIPMDVIYGSRDRVVLRAKAKEIFGVEATHITTHIVESRHNISPTASAFITECVDAGIMLEKATQQA